MIGFSLALLDGSASDIAIYFSVALVSSVKFFWGVIMALLKPGFGFWEILISAGGGAWLGALVFTYFGTEIRKLILSRFKPSSVSFARRRQMYIFWKKYGLLGVTLLIPLISPMVSIGIAVSFQEKPRRILAYMTVAIFVYTALMAIFKEAVLQWVA